MMPRTTFAWLLILHFMKWQKGTFEFSIILKTKKGLGKESTSRIDLLNHFLWSFIREECGQGLGAISFVFVWKPQKTFQTKKRTVGLRYKNLEPKGDKRYRSSQRHATLPTDPVFLYWKPPGIPLLLWMLWFLSCGAVKWEWMRISSALSLPDHSELAALTNTLFSLFLTVWHGEVTPSLPEGKLLLKLAEGLGWQVEERKLQKTLENPTQGSKTPKVFCLWEVSVIFIIRPDINPRETEYNLEDSKYNMKTWGLLIKSGETSNQFSSWFRSH